MVASARALLLPLIRDQNRDVWLRVIKKEMRRRRGDRGGEVNTTARSAFAAAAATHSRRTDTDYTAKLCFGMITFTQKQRQSLLIRDDL